MSIPKLLEKYPEMAVIVISMHSQRALVRALREAGASGYILKDDRAAMLELPAIIRLVHGWRNLFQPGGGPAADGAARRGRRPADRPPGGGAVVLRGLPGDQHGAVAQQLHIAQSTVRNLLSGAYLRLEVPNRTAAIARARQLGLIAPD